MLNITYTPSDQSMAERIRTDLSAVPLKLDHPVLIVLASPDSMQDESVRQAIKQANKDNTRVAIFKVKPVEVAADLGELPALDLTQKYDARRMVAYINRVDLGQARIRRSQRLFFFVGAGALIMFAAAIWGIASGNVRFPVEEYATEYAMELNQISTFAAPTLEYVMPRTTDDAVNFPATVEALPTRIVIYAIETATALPLSVSSTQSAIETQAIATSAALTQIAPIASPTGQ